MLFYVLTILALITKHADFLFVVMAWIFVLTRIGHAYIHCTNNNLRARGLLFGIGALVLMVMWLIFMSGSCCSGCLEMTPGARLAAAIEVLTEIGARRRPATDTLKDWGLSHRFAGSGDRAGIAGLVYDALRRRASSAYLMGEDTPRATLLGMLVRERGLDIDVVARLADGGGFAAAADRRRTGPAGCRRYLGRAAARRRRLSGVARSASHSRVRRRTRGGGRGAGIARAARPARQQPEGRPRRGGEIAGRSRAGADALVARGSPHQAQGRGEKPRCARRVRLFEGPY